MIQLSGAMNGYASARDAFAKMLATASAESSTVDDTPTSDATVIYECGCNIDGTTMKCTGSIVCGRGRWGYGVRRAAP